MTAKERMEAAMAAADMNNKESIKELFNATANHYYLTNTEKSFKELSEYLSYEQSSWADGINDLSVWKSIEECADCAEESAQIVIDNEQRETGPKLTEKEQSMAQRHGYSKEYRGAELRTALRLVKKGVFRCEYIANYRVFKFK